MAHGTVHGVQQHRSNFSIFLFPCQKLWTCLLPDFPEPVVRRAACGDGALCYLFPPGSFEWRLQPAASSVTRQCLWGNQPHLHCLVVLNFPVSVFLIFLAHALRTSSSWQERSRILSSWRTSAPPTVMRVWFRTLFTRIPAGVCWCTCLRPAANTVQEAAIRAQPGHRQG